MYNLFTHHESSKTDISSTRKNRKGILTFKELLYLTENDQEYRHELRPEK